MKFHETSFDDYIQSVKTYNIHKKHTKIYKLLSSDISTLKNIVLYGPPGIGKYSQLLWILKQHSPSLLKYEKNFSVTFQKKHEYWFKMSDVHYEIDMALLGCNSRLLWNEVFTQIIDIINANVVKQWFIVCKNFQSIHNELLDVFYNYMQHFNDLIQIKFIILTTQISFIPTNILNTCHIIKYARPTKSVYQKCIFPVKLPNMKLNQIINIKNLRQQIVQLDKKHEVVCNRIIANMIDINNIDFLQLRDHLYNLLIYQLDVAESLFYIIEHVAVVTNLNCEDLYRINVELVRFFKYYNNNYRPIYHLERIVLYISSIIHGLPTSIQHIKSNT